MFRIDRRLMQQAGGGGGGGSGNPPLNGNQNLSQMGQPSVASKIAGAGAQVAGGTIRSGLELVFKEADRPFSDFVRNAGETGRAAFEALGFKKIGGAGKLLADLGAEALDLRERFVDFNQTTFETSFAMMGFQKSIEASSELFQNFGEGAKDVQAITGESLGEIQKNFKSLYNESLNLAGGFTKETIPAGEQAANAMKLLGEASVVARMSGVDFNKMQQAMNTLLIQQGESGEKSVRVFAYLSNAIKDTGVSMDFAMSQIENLSRQFEFLEFDSGRLASVLANVAKTQKEMSGEKYTFKSPQQAMESYSRVLQKVAQDQQDFSQALFYSSLQGKGLEDALDFMMDTDPTAGLSRAMAGMREAFGGELLDIETARRTGRTEEYMAQSMIMQRQLGLRSPREYEAFLKAEKAGKPVEAALAEAKETREKTAEDTLANMQKQNENFYPQIMKQDQLRNKYLGHIAMSAGLLADRFIREKGVAKVTEVLGGLDPEVAKLKDALTTSQVDALRPINEEMKKASSAQQQALDTNTKAQQQNAKATSENTTSSNKISEVTKEANSTSKELARKAQITKTVGGTSFTIDPNRAAFDKTGSGVLYKRDGMFEAQPTTQILDYSKIQGPVSSATTTQKTTMGEIKKPETTGPSSLAPTATTGITTELATPESPNINVNLYVDGKPLATRLEPYFDGKYQKTSAASRQAKGQLSNG